MSINLENSRKNSLFSRFFFNLPFLGSKGGWNGSKIFFNFFFIFFKAYDMLILIKKKFLNILSCFFITPKVGGKITNFSPIWLQYSLKGLYRRLLHTFSLFLVISIPNQNIEKKKIWNFTKKKNQCHVTKMYHLVRSVPYWIIMTLTIKCNKNSF